MGATEAKPLASAAEKLGKYSRPALKTSGRLLGKLSGAFGRVAPVVGPFVSLYGGLADIGRASLEGKAISASRLCVGSYVNKYVQTLAGYATSGSSHEAKVSAKLEGARAWERKAIGDVHRGLKELGPQKGQALLRYLRETHSGGAKGIERALRGTIRNHSVPHVSPQLRRMLFPDEIGARARGRPKAAGIRGHERKAWSAANVASARSSRTSLKGPPGKRSNVGTSSAVKPREKITFKKGSVVDVPVKRMTFKKGSVVDVPVKRTTFKKGSVVDVPVKRMTFKKGSAVNVPVEKIAFKKGSVVKASTGAGGRSRPVPALNRIKGVPKLTKEGFVPSPEVGGLFNSKRMDRIRKYVPALRPHRAGVPVSGTVSYIGKGLVNPNRARPVHMPPPMRAPMRPMGR
jgi:hypothetical protein